MACVARIGIIGGGPGGYEAALVAAQLGAEVTVVDRDGLGGSAVLTDCVPSKTLIATAESMTDTAESGQLGVRLGAADGQLPESQVSVDLARVNARVTKLARTQSEDIAARLDREGVRVLRGIGRLDGPGRVVAQLADGGEEVIEADAVLLSTGARPAGPADGRARRRAHPHVGADLHRSTRCPSTSSWSGRA